MIFLDQSYNSLLRIVTNEIASFCIDNRPGYLKDSNAAAHSVDIDIFYAVIRQPARSKMKVIS